MLIVTQSLRFLTKHCVLYEAESLVIFVYVRFLETLLKDQTNDIKKKCVIMKQFWLIFALTKNKSEIISASFFFFFFFA